MDRCYIPAQYVVYLALKDSLKGGLNRYQRMKKPNRNQVTGELALVWSNMAEDAIQVTPFVNRILGGFIPSLKRAEGWIPFEIIKAIENQNLN